MIDDADISIVVQGPIMGKSLYNITEETTKLICLRLRYLFPKSEIILSTAKGAKVQGIVYDKVIFTDDPGATWFDLEDQSRLNNCNRMIVSTFAGIKASTRKYVFKIRSDLFTLSKSFLDYFYKFPCFNYKYKFVENRIIAFSTFSLKAEYSPEFTMPRPYHVSDWAYFGYREDLLKLYNIPLINEPEFSQWFLHRKKTYLDLFPSRLWKMSPDQYVPYSFFSKFISINFNHTADISNNNAELSEKLIANNFLILDQDQFALTSLKHIYSQILYEPLLASTSIFFRTWLEDYHRYCNVPINVSWLWQKLLVIQQSITYKIINKIMIILNKKFFLYSKYIAYKVKKSSLSNQKLIK